MKALLERGATLGNIRSAHNRLSEILDTPYPFIEHSKLKVLKRDVIAPIEQDLLNLTDGQYLLQYVDDYLKDVRFEGATPVSLKPDGNDSAVIIDARVRFGEPTVEGTRIPTADVYDLWVAEGNDSDAVAEAYGLSLQQVHSAVAYEKERRAPWAA